MIFLQKTVLGVDIGSFNIKMVEAVSNNGKMEILNYAITRTPENSVNDGKIMDVGKVSSAIEEMLAKNSIKTKSVIGVISSSALITREVNIPKMPESDIEKYIQLDSQQYFPVNLDDYVLDFKILEEVKGMNGNEYITLLAAIPKVIINDYMKTFNKLKLTVEAIDIVPNALSKYLADCLPKKQPAGKQGNSGTVAVVDMGAETTTVSIVADGILQFSRTIPSGGNGITQNLATTFSLSASEAEEYKLKNGEIVLEAYGAESLTNNVSDAIKPILDGIASYINKFIEFYSSRSNSSKISSIYLIGGSSLLRGVEEYYRVIFNIPTRRISLVDGIVNKTNKPTAQKDLPILLNAFATTFRE